MPDAAQALSDYIAANLPLAGAMQVKVEVADDSQVRLRIPLAPNLNHEKTAFGGSIAAAGMLAGWGLIWLQLRNLSPVPRLVIAESQMRFIRPIAGEFIAACAWPRPETWATQAENLYRTGRVRVPLRTELTHNRRTAAVHDGTFVVIAT